MVAIFETRIANWNTGGENIHSRVRIGLLYSIDKEELKKIEMANVWFSHIKIMNKSAKKREKILKELHSILDPDDYHGFANENFLFYQTKWEFHNIMGDLEEFSLEHPDVIFHIDTSGDVHNSWGYPESQELFDEYYIHEYIQNGKIFKNGTDSEFEPTFSII